MQFASYEILLPDHGVVDGVFRAVSLDDSNRDCLISGCSHHSRRCIDCVTMSLKWIIWKYVFLIAFVSALPPLFNLIGLAIVYWMMFFGGLRIFSNMFHMPSDKNLWHLLQAQYMKNKIFKNGGSISNISTSSPLPKSNGAGSAGTP